MWLQVQRAKWSCSSHPHAGATLLPSILVAQPLRCAHSAAWPPPFVPASGLESREIGKGEGFHFKKKKKETSCEKPGMEEGMETSFFQAKDAVAAVLGTIRQVIT